MGVSDVALFLSAFPVFVHGSEFLFPMHSRFVVNLLLPLFGFATPVLSDARLTLANQITMLEAAIDAAPSDKWKAAADYVFVLLFEQRQGSSGFIGCALGALYAYTLPLAQRHPIHFLFLVIAICMTISNLNHAGVSFLGYHPMVTTDGKHVGFAFAPFWIAVAYFNWTAFVASKAALAKVKTA